MGLLDLLGGGDNDRSDMEDFANRYDRGRPHEGYDDDEVHRRYDRVRRNVSPEEYETSAREAFSRMSPQERRQAARLLKDRAREQNYQLGGGYDNDDDDDSRYERDPGALAGMFGSVNRRDPDRLGGLLGGGGGGGGMNPLAKAALAGVAAMAVRQALQNRR